MPRMLAFTLEPSDALLGVLRLRAAAEAGRWPRDVTSRFRVAMDREFARVEDTVRTLGVCYTELENQRVADLDRRPQSRFNDVDGALHLAACAIEVSLDLDHLRVAAARGDDAVRERAAALALGIRSVLWYAAHSDLLVCPRAICSGVEATPERALAFVESYLDGAVGGGVGPPIAPREPASGEHRAVAPETLRGGDALPFSEPTDVFTLSRPARGADGQTDAYPSLPDANDERTHPARALAPETHALIFAVGHETTHPASDLGPGAPAHQTAGAPLSADARFFLIESGAPWPCDALGLSAARAALLARSPTTRSPGGDRDGARAWLDRVERGFRELRHRASR